MLDFYLRLKIRFAKEMVNDENQAQLAAASVSIADFALRSALFVEWNLGPKYAKKHVNIVLKYQISYLDAVLKFIPKTLERNFKKSL